MDNNESTSEDDYNHDVPAFAEIDEHQLMAKDLLLIKRSLKMKLDSWALNTLDDAFFKINLKSHIYKMSSTEVDMTNFCRAVLYLMNGDYEISEHIISEIMEKYTSSVFFILKGIGLQQQSRFVALIYYSTLQLICNLNTCTFLNNYFLFFFCVYNTLLLIKTALIINPIFYNNCF